MNQNSLTAIPCIHSSGVMIPQVDDDGNYVKPEFMICNNCRLVTKPQIGIGV